MRGKPVSIGCLLVLALVILCRPLPASAATTADPPAGGLGEPATQSDPQPRAGSNWSPFVPQVTAVQASAPLAEVAGEAYGWPIVEYWVNPGDTLYSIAQAHQTSVAYLKRLNAGLVAKHLVVGQSLQVPSEHPGKPVQMYRVRSGDTLWRIARLYNTDSSILAVLNGIQDPRTLHVGSLLIIRD